MSHARLDRHSSCSPFSFTLSFFWSGWDVSYNDVLVRRLDYSGPFSQYGLTATFFPCWTCGLVWLVMMITRLGRSGWDRVGIFFFGVIQDFSVCGCGFPRVHATSQPAFSVCVCNVCKVYPYASWKVVYPLLYDACFFVDRINILINTMTSYAKYSSVRVCFVRRACLKRQLKTSFCLFDCYKCAIITSTERKLVLWTQPRVESQGLFCI